MFDYIREKKAVVVNSSEALNEFEKISKERKQSIKDGETPDWYITQGYMLFQRNYSHNGESVRDAFHRTAYRLARHYKINPELAYKKFFNLQWSGKLAPSTPVINNTGLDRGDSVSCSGGRIGDSVHDFYTNLRESAVLSQRGYGTSSYLGDIRPRGTPISTGGKASGSVPVFDDHIQMANKISQGNNRRGQWAGYLPVMHGDFDEMWDYVFKNSAVANIGWLFYQRDIDALNRNDPEMVRRWNMVMYLRSRFGKGYIVKPDTANWLAPEAIKRSGIPIVASNLCTEIMLPQNDEYTFSCVLSSLNLAKWDEMEDEDIFWSIIFLDCVVSETLEQTEGIGDIEKLHNFTRDFRALGLGTLGWHTYLQSKMLTMDSLQAKLLNKQIFARINKVAQQATRHLYDLNGAPKYCKDLGIANATLLAIAPNTSSALLAGGMSQGIEPLAANTYNQNTAAGEVTRMNPTLISHLKDIGRYSEQLVEDLQVKHQGSIQSLDFLNDHVKRVFATANEIDQNVLVNLAADRQPNICQGQSLNLTFNGTEQEISTVTKRALNNPYIKSLYYQRSIRSVRASSGECLQCEG